MKPFRFAWNHEVFNKEDTLIILITILIAAATLITVLVLVILKSNR